MNTLPLPANESDRLRALREYAILDTPPEEAFDELTVLAAQICQTPVAFVSFVDADRQWNKSRLGWDIAEIPRVHSFCAHAILQPGILIVENASKDPRFAGNPFVANNPGLRSFAGVPLIPKFYAASPLVTPEGHAIGSLCVIDTRARTITTDQGQALRTLARQVITQLELRRSLAELNAKHLETETALKHSEAFYESLVESLPQNIFRKNLEGRFTFVNTRFCQALGKTRDEIIGKTDADFFPKELAAKYLADDQNVIKGGRHLDTIERHQTADGDSLHVHVIKSVVHGPNREVMGIQGIFWDETERVKAREALASERDLLRAMLENIPDNIYFKDRQSRFTLCSDALARYLGLRDATEAIGKTDFDFFSADHARQAFNDEQEILKTGRPIIAKTECERSRDGIERWILTTKVPLRTKKGEMIGTFGISKDISDLKKIQSELSQARDAALESARLKSEFLANMSHEIRTPMNAVIGMSGLLLETDLTDEQRDFTETIRNSADALLGIINDILDFSKIEAGKLAIERIEFELNEVVEGTVDILAESAQARKLELASWIPEEIPRRLIGDPGRLRQILTNLVSNAVKFTESGEVVVNVVREKDSASDVTLRFEVRDTGIGIAQEAQGRLFSAFTQADGSMTRKYGGTGLGLAISKQLAELMGGRVGFTSSPGSGSTFWFAVPLKKQTNPVVTPATRPTLEGTRVLIVDDNATNLEIVRRQVSSWNMRPTTASGGEEALRLLRSALDTGKPFDLGILDMQMPAMDGITLAREIKALPGASEMKLLILTSLGYLAEEKTWRSAGISAYLIKPVKQSRLLDTLARIMQVGSPAPAPARTESDTAFLRRQTGRTDGRPRILVAEDNVVNQKVALRQLGKLGYTAEAVANGLEVLNSLEHISYDIVLMDCQMPELDGYETTRRIRSSTKGRFPYIIAMTANALAGDREKCLAAGMDDYVTKPVRVEDLNDAVRRGLALAHQAPETESAPMPILDPAVLRGLRALKSPGIPDPLPELIDLFIADAPERLARVGDALKARHAQNLRAAAHSLKGSAANLGALRVASLAGGMMDFVSRKDFAAADEVLPFLQTAFEEARVALEREKKRE